MQKDWTGNKKSTFVTLGASNHTDKERQVQDFYATDPKALELFAPKFPIAHKVYECSCGNGTLSEWLRKHGHDVLSTDIANRGYGIPGINFLDTTKACGFISEWSRGGRLTSSRIHLIPLPQSSSSMPSTLFLTTVT